MPSIDDLKNNIKKAGIGDLKEKLQQKSSKQPAKQKQKKAPKGREIKVEGESIDDCLDQAASILGASRINLDYEIIQRGKGGFLGMGKQPFVLKVFLEGEIDLDDITSVETQDDEFDHDLEFEEIQKDGDVKIYVKKSGIFMKVTPPVKDGSEVTLDDARTELARKGIQNYDLSQVAKIVKKAKGKEEKIGKWVPNPQYDSKAVLEISEDQMKAMVTVTAPILSGRQLEPDEIVDLLKNNGVLYGINHDKIKGIIEKEIYNVPVVVADGDPPKRGDDAVINYHFKTKHDEIEFEEEEDGSIDFKKTDLVQNVVAGQVLATKTPPTKGVNGRTVTNVKLPAANGLDVEMKAGDNVDISPDGNQAIAAAPGQAVLLGDKIEVEKIFEVNSDVDFNTGNIVFLGTVLIKGSVQDDFSVKASHDIIIKGDVGKADLEADGDVIVSGGLLGKNEGKVQAGGSLYAKFIENVKISVGQDVVAKEGILHSTIDAGSRIICNGKRAAIQGGRCRAGQEINSKIIGSPAYTETICEAGVDPQTKERLEKLEQEHINTEKALNKLFININTLSKQKEKLEAESKKLPEDKDNMLKRMIRAKKELSLRMKEIQDEVEELRNYLITLENTGKISAKVNFLPGVEVIIKNANFQVKQEFKFTSFVYEAGYIKPVKYQDIEGFEEDDRASSRR